MLLSFQEERSIRKIKKQTLKNLKTMEPKKKNILEIIVKVIVAALTAFVTAITTASCMGHGPLFL